jgi:Ca2+-binding EF-hand superfamily protein
MRRHTLPAVGATALLAVAFAVGAADSDRTIAGFADSNGDQRISYDEFADGMSAAALREMDKNGDGAVTPAETASAGGQGNIGATPIVISGADADGDGKVSRDELSQAIRDAAPVRATFQSYDTDGDGFLSASELNAMQSTPQIRIQF